jgi:hypothetical protein
VSVWVVNSSVHSKVVLNWTAWRGPGLNMYLFVSYCMHCNVVYCGCAKLINPFCYMASVI